MINSMKKIHQAVIFTPLLLVTLSITIVFQTGNGVTATEFNRIEVAQLGILYPSLSGTTTYNFNDEQYRTLIDEVLRKQQIDENKVQKDNSEEEMTRQFLKRQSNEQKKLGELKHLSILDAAHILVSYLDIIKYIRKSKKKSLTSQRLFHCVFFRQISLYFNEINTDIGTIVFVPNNLLVI